MSKDAVSFEDLRDAFLFCRTVSHAWFEVVADDLPKPDFGWRFSLQCERCQCKRHDVIDDRTGEIVSRRYLHPDGYELDEKVTRSEMRNEWARRRQYDLPRARSTRKRKRSAA